MADEQQVQSEAQEAPETGAEQNDPTTELRAELEAAKAKADDNWNQYLRLAAEMENFRKRAERDVEQTRKFAIERFANELLAVKDSLEMGLAAVADADAGETVEKLREGKEMTLKLLNQAFEKFGISEIDPAGEAFNPERHEAMATQPSKDHAPDTVVSVIQKGYEMNGRLLRPARVLVARAPDDGGAA